MPSTVAHAASASLVALTVAHVSPNDGPYVLAALVAASVVDLDHLVYAVKDRRTFQRLGYRGNLHKARSLFHELFGLLIAGGLSGPVFLADQKLARVIFIAFTIHLVQDWLFGRSAPFKPVDNTPTQFFSLTFKQKVIADVMIVAASGALWILFLAGRL